MTFPEQGKGNRIITIPPYLRQIGCGQSVFVKNLCRPRKRIRKSERQRQLQARPTALAKGLRLIWDWS